jgi:hypothetical protein
MFSASGSVIGAGNSTAGTTLMAPHNAIADTGTTLLHLPGSILSAYYGQVAGAVDSWEEGGWIYPCNSTLPDLTILIADYKAVIPGHTITFAPVDSLTFDNATICYGGLQSSDMFPFAIYGGIFLKAQFTVFHHGDLKLGFAPKPPVLAP